MFFNFMSDKVAIDSRFECWVSGPRRFSVCQWSTGGGINRANKQYMTAQEIFLTRIFDGGMKIGKIAVVKGKKNGLPYHDLAEIDLNALNGIQDVKSLRIKIGTLTKDVDVKGLGGNRTRKVLYEIYWPGQDKLLLSEVITNLSFSPEPPGQNHANFSLLEINLKSRDESNLLFSLGQISDIVGSLPKKCASKRFWNNVHGLHESENKHWLCAGFEASWNAKEKSVSFVRKNTPTDDPFLFEAQVEIERQRIKKRGYEEQCPAGLIKPKKVRSEVVRYERSPAVVAWVLEKADGKCEGCGKEPFVSEKGENYLEVHHLRPLAEGGPDTVDNTVALCPDCHRELHFGASRSKKRDRILKEVKRLIDHPVRDRTS